MNTSADAIPTMSLLDQSTKEDSQESHHLGPVVSWANDQKASTSKRKLEDIQNDKEDDSQEDDSKQQQQQQQKQQESPREHKMRRVEPLAPRLLMTTVICLHAAVAQKSYRSEKRFLCPPPVVHIEGPVWQQIKTQQLSMVVVNETGERTFEQKAPLDNNMTASFKFLYVGGTAKAKSFQLSLDISEPPPPDQGPDQNTPGRVWASFESAPVSIISKPSKKTAKTRNIASCILAGGPVSLFNRINAQTVRTKYMTIENGALCASNAAWSAFNVNVIRRPNELLTAGNGPQPVTYGCEIVLSDTHSGTATSPLIIRKVDKGRIAADDGGPVSQMQKIALQRVNPDGSRHYLSAAGPMAAAGTSSNSSTVTQSNGSHSLHFQAAKFRTETKDGVTVCTDEVDDHLCWTIVGISKFQYTFFDSKNENNKIPQLPITPFPTLFTAPIYRPANNTIELTVSNFFYTHPTEHVAKALDVHLGQLGPLNHRVFQSGVTGAAMDDRYIPAGPLHTIVVVDMPPLPDVLKVLEKEETKTLPLLFIRSYDGVGYHSGRTITCENMFQGLGGVEAAWLGEEGMNGWTLRVM